jgi:hypothetical protein
MPRYRSLYERLVANTVLAVPDNPQSCWLYTGHLQASGYGRVCIRNEDGQPRNAQAHRAMLEEVLGVLFPFDEAGHLCGTPACLNPDHLEVQTRWHNMAEQRSQFGSTVLYVDTARPWIPVLFPREEIDPPFTWAVPDGTVEPSPLPEIAA